MPLTIENVAVPEVGMALPKGYFKIIDLRGKALPKNVDNFRLRFKVGIYADKAAYLEGKQPVHVMEPSVIGTGTTTLSALYGYIKTLYPQYTIIED